MHRVVWPRGKDHENVLLTGHGNAKKMQTIFFGRGEANYKPCVHNDLSNCMVENGIPYCCPVFGGSAVFYHALHPAEAGASAYNGILKCTTIIMTYIIIICFIPNTALR